jgi:hypothetical protein
MRNRTTKTLISLAVLLWLAVGAQAVNTTSTLINGYLGLYSDYSSGSSTLDVTLSSGSVKQIHELRLTLASAAVTDTITVSIDSSISSGHDVTLTTSSLSSQPVYIWRPAQPVFLRPDDDLEVDCPNTSTTAWYLEIIWSEPRR